MQKIIIGNIKDCQIRENTEDRFILRKYPNINFREDFKDISVSGNSIETSNSRFIEWVNNTVKFEFEKNIDNFTWRSKYNVLKIHFRREYYDNEMNVYNLIQNIDNHPNDYHLIRSLKKHTPDFISSFETDNFFAILRKHIRRHGKPAQCRKELTRNFVMKFQPSIFNQSTNKTHCFVMQPSGILKCINFSKFRMNDKFKTTNVSSALISKYDDELKFKVLGSINSLKVNIPFFDKEFNSEKFKILYLENVVVTSNKVFTIIMKGKLSEWIRSIISPSWKQSYEINCIKWSSDDNQEMVLFTLDKTIYIENKYIYSEIINEYEDDEFKQYALHVKL
jgi:hypothetical protein